ncbi:MAG: hypothetical protein WCW33_05470 [Candidatus Babeliales bacterium]
MKNALKKLITVFCLSLGLSTTTPPQLAATTKDNIELVTALLRGYAAYSEYELRNDTSRSAHVKRALIHAVRVTNDLCALKIDRCISIANTAPLLLFDTCSIIKSLYSVFTTDQKIVPPDQDMSQPKTQKDKDLKVVCGFLLPAAETLGALIRTNLISENVDVHDFGDIFLSYARYEQLVFAAPKGSKLEKLWGTLFILAGIGLIVKLVSVFYTGVVAQEKAYNNLRQSYWQLQIDGDRLLEQSRSQHQELLQRHQQLQQGDIQVLEHNLQLLNERNQLLQQQVQLREQHIQLAEQHQFALDQLNQLQQQLNQVPGAPIG